MDVQSNYRMCLILHFEAADAKLGTNVLPPVINDDTLAQHWDRIVHLNPIFSVQHAKFPTTEGEVYCASACRLVQVGDSG